MYIFLSTKLKKKYFQRLIGRLLINNMLLKNGQINAIEYLDSLQLIILIYVGTL